MTGDQASATFSVECLERELATRRGHEHSRRRVQVNARIGFVPIRVAMKRSRFLGIAGISCRASLGVSSSGPAEACRRRTSPRSSQPD